MTTPWRRAVFLDRDGVLNRSVVRDGKPFPPRGVREVQLFPDAPAALGLLADAGFILVGATNQPDVARGTAPREEAEAINAWLLARLPLVEISSCYEDDDACPRRKPNPGMLLDAAAKYGIVLADSFMIGDRWKDVEAGRRAGCRTVFLNHGYREPKPAPPADFDATSLSQAVCWILAQISTEVRTRDYPSRLEDQTVCRRRR